MGLTFTRTPTNTKLCFVRVRENFWSEVAKGTINYFTLQLIQGQRYSVKNYDRVDFFDFVSDFSSLALFIVSIAAFLCKTHVNFHRNSKMLKHLYWEEDPSAPSDASAETLMDQKERKRFEYPFYKFFWM